MKQKNCYYYCRHDRVVLHKAIWKLGLQYMEGTVCGSNARCIALLIAMKEVCLQIFSNNVKRLVVIVLIFYIMYL